MATKDNLITERKRLYEQGAYHRRFKMRPFYKEHPFFSDYMDGYRGRPFGGRPMVLALLSKLLFRH